jgi:6,7-dimethyl-8-ribityllumazine synthase
MVFQRSEAGRFALVSSSGPDAKLAPLSSHHQSSLVTPHRLLYTASAFILKFDSQSAEAEKFLQPEIHQGRLNAEGFRFAIIASRWNDFLTSRLVEGALDALERLGADEKAVELFKVPGSFEIPLLARKVAATGKWDAVVCVGTIIRGQTPHFEYIASEVTKGIAQAGMETDVPVVYGIVTADTLEQAIDRAGVKAGNKGFEAAMSAVELVNLYKEVTGDK